MFQLMFIYDVIEIGFLFLKIQHYNESIPIELFQK